MKRVWMHAKALRAAVPDRVWIGIAATLAGMQLVALATIAGQAVQRGQALRLDAAAMASAAHCKTLASRGERESCGSPPLLASGL